MEVSSHLTELPDDCFSTALGTGGWVGGWVYTGEWWCQCYKTGVRIANRLLPLERPTQSAHRALNVHGYLNLDDYE